MDFGVVIQPDPPASRVIELTKKAEDLGFTHGWTFDSHVLWQEPFVIYSRMLAENPDLVVGPMVTNPGTRDWTVIASLFATLNEMYGDRDHLRDGPGRLGPAVHRQQADHPRRPCRVDAGHQGPGRWRGSDHNGHRASGSRGPKADGWNLPMWGAGYGPKALATVGEECDGYILQLADPVPPVDRGRRSS
jgi:alkanesulfonate monooxygenase SsuD/methylene tetrahydromethanopterin reductase-like flavin-dependent oxidoreductase (luciferase family)